VNADHEGKLDALGDPTRRAVLRLLRKGPMAVAEIARAFPVSRPAISQHLRILKDAGLVTDSPVATRRLYALNAEAFGSLRAYFDDFWTAALGDFAQEIARRAKTRRKRA
jgi:DNA-binding transcriptional ArsR family regulator